MKPHSIYTVCTTLLLAFPNLQGEEYKEIVHDLHQSQADEFNRFAVTPNTNDTHYHYIFNIKEDIVFQNYHCGQQGTRGGNVFLFGSSNADYAKLATIQGTGNDSYELVFDNNHSLFSETGTAYDYMGRSGGATHFSNVIFRDLKSIVFSNNSLNNQNATTASQQIYTFGGATSSLKMRLDNVAEFTVSGNMATGVEAVFGGGVYSSKFTTGLLVDGSTTEFVEGTGTGNITFVNNRIVLQNGGYGGYGGGYCNYEGSGKNSDHFQNTGVIRFHNNSIAYADTINAASKVSRMNGGALYSTNNFFTNTGNVEFVNNSADASNQSQVTVVHGGAISSLSTTLKGVKDTLNSGYAIRLEGNRAVSNGTEGSAGYGGAISASRVIIHESGNTLIANNSASTKGGGFYIKKFSSSLSNYLYADHGDITFKGNTDSLTDGNKRESGVANAIHIEEADDGNSTLLYLQAREGREVNFYDPITSDSTTSAKLGIYINAATENPGTGTIRFSGKHVAATLAGSEHRADYAERLAKSKRSDVNASIMIGNGTLVMEHGVTLGRKYEATAPDLGTGAQIALRGGVLDISGSAEHGDTTLAGRKISFDQGASMTLKAGRQAFFEANEVEIDQGVAIDLGYYFANGQAVSHDGLHIASGTLSLGGEILLVDNNSNFYQSEDWLNDREFVLFDITNTETVTGDFTGIVTVSSGSGVITDPSLYQGEWSLVRDNDQIIAKWTSFRINPIPEPSSFLFLLTATAGCLRRRR